MGPQKPALPRQQILSYGPYFVNPVRAGVGEVGLKGLALGEESSILVLNVPVWGKGEGINCPKRRCSMKKVLAAFVVMVFAASMAFAADMAVPATPTAKDVKATKKEAVKASKAVKKEAQAAKKEAMSAAKTAAPVVK